MGANPNYQDKDKRASLHYAVNFSNSGADASFEMENLLLQYKADINLQDKQGRNCIFYAFIKIKYPFINNNIDPIETVSSLLAN